MGLQRFERRLERLVEGGFGKAFRSGLQPVEIGRRLVRELDIGPHARRARHRRPEPLHCARGRGRPRPLRGLPRRARSASCATPCATARASRTTASSGRSRSRSWPTPGPESAISRSTPRSSRAPDGPAAALVLPDGSRIQLGDDPVRIGRLPDCAIALSDSQVSRHHAEVRRAEHGLRGGRPRLAQRHHRERRQGAGAGTRRRRRDQRR